MKMNPIIKPSLFATGRVLAMLLVSLLVAPG